MKTISTLIALLAMTLAAQAQDAKPAITLSAKGEDVRIVLHDLFTQQKRNYVLDPNVRVSLYLALQGVDFDQALAVICKCAGLKFEVEGGVYYIAGASAKTHQVIQLRSSASSDRGLQPVQVARGATPAKTPSDVATDTRPRGILPGAAFQKRVTTRLSKTDIRAVFAEISKQTGVPIEVDKSVPNYKLDAFLIDTSLKFAIDAINSRAKLQYRLTSFRSILIYMPKEDETTRVQLVAPGGSG